MFLGCIEKRSRTVTEFLGRRFRTVSGRFKGASRNVLEEIRNVSEGRLERFSMIPECLEGASRNFLE